MDLFDNFVASLYASGLIASGFVWLTKAWLSERLKQSIQHEYATELKAHIEG